MNILVLAALTDATGNAVTARRLAAHLASEHRVVLADSVGASAQSLRELAAREQIDVAIGVHALLAGPFLRTLGTPYALIFGGTDLYERVHELEERQMARAVAGAARLIAFSPENVARAEWMWPSIAGRVECIPQAVDVAPASDFSLRAELGLGANDTLLVLPTGIRRVKDPLHVVRAVSAWHQRDPRVHLAVAGAVLEPDYAEGALRVLADAPGVHFVEALPREKMLAAIREADVVLNTSLSEGMCGVLLEAMRLGTPVVARRSAGNESLVAHGHTGLLYDAPEEAVLWSQALVASPALRARIAATALSRAERVHSLDAERNAYCLIADELSVDGRPSAMPPPAPPLDELAAVLQAAERVGLGAEAIAALTEMVATIRASAELTELTHRMAGVFDTAPPGVAIDAVRALEIDIAPGGDAVGVFYLLLALMEVPAAEARHRARGIDPAITRATLADLAIYAEHFRERTGVPGITIEILEWAQRYLRGELIGLGILQLDLRPFARELRVFRHRDTRGLTALTLSGHPIDLATGDVGGEPVEPPDPSAWEIALEPGTPILDMQIIAKPMLDSAIAESSFVSLESIARSMRQAYALFAKLAPETAPVGACGESWLLDARLPALLPENEGIRAFQRACCFYPSAITEERTIGRLFGPGVDRAALASLPRDAMNPLQRAIAEHLDAPDARLAARGGFVLREELSAMPEWAE